MGLEDVVNEYESRPIKRTISNLSRYISMYTQTVLPVGILTHVYYNAHTMKYTPQSILKPISQEFAEEFLYFGLRFQACSLLGVGLGVYLREIINNKGKKKRPLETLDDALLSHPIRNSLLSLGALMGSTSIAYHVAANITGQDVSEIHSSLKVYFGLHFPLAEGLAMATVMEVFNLAKFPRPWNAVKVLKNLLLSEITSNPKYLRKNIPITNENGPPINVHIQSSKKDTKFREVHAASTHQALYDIATKRSTRRRMPVLSTFSRAVSTPIKLLSWKQFKECRAATRLGDGHYGELHNIAKIAKETKDPELMLSVAGCFHDFINTLRENPRGLNLAGAYEFLQDKKHPEEWARALEENLFKDALEGILKETPPSEFQGRARITREDLYSGKQVIFKLGNRMDHEIEMAFSRACAKRLSIKLPQMLCVCDANENAYLAMRREQGKSVYDLKDWELYLQVARSTAEFHNAHFESEFPTPMGNYVNKIIQSMARQDIDLKNSSSMQKLRSVEEDVLGRDAHAANFLRLESGELCGIDYYPKEMQPRAIDTLKLINQGAFRNDHPQRTLQLADAYAKAAEIDPCNFRSEVLSFWLPWAMHASTLKVSGPIGEGEQKAASIKNGIWAATQIGQEDLIPYANLALGRV